MIKTVISGTLIFILSQYFLELVIRPYLEYQNIKIKIGNKLKFYSNILTNPLELSKKGEVPSEVIDRYQEVSREIRMLSCELESAYYSSGRLIRKFFIKESKKSITDSALLLIRISNGLFKLFLESDTALRNDSDLQEVKKKLNIVF